MAKRPIAVVASDTHCMPSAWVGRPGLWGDAYYAFSLAVSQCLEKNLPLILTGDIIDAQDPPAETAQFLRSQADRLAKRKLPMSYILGNHEVTVPPWLDAVHDWPRCVHGLSFELGGAAFYGVNYTPFDRLPALMQAVPETTDVVLCHQAWTEFMGTLCRTDGSLTMIPHASLTITGDFHQCLTLKTVNAQGKPMQVLSPGSLVQTEITETEPRRLHILYDDLSVQSSALIGRRQLEPPPLYTEHELAEFLEQVGSQLEQARQQAEDDGLPDYLQKPLLRVAYATTIPGVYGRLVKAIGDRAHFFRREIRPEPPEKRERSKKQRDAVKAGLIGCLAEVVPDTKSALYGYTRSLLEAAQRGEKPELALQRLRQEFLQ